MRTVKDRLVGGGSLKLRLMMGFIFQVHHVSFRLSSACSRLGGTTDIQTNAAQLGA
jgi:hypothetical protein